VAAASGGGIDVGVVVDAVDPEPEDPEEVVADAVEEIRRVLERDGQAKFRDLTSGVEDRLSVVVRFLAVLELLKQGLADVVQASTLGDVGISWTGDSSWTGDAEQ